MPDKRNFYPEQKPTASEFNAAFGDFHTAFEDVITRAVGWGWLYGANLSYTPSTTPPAVSVSSFLGYSQAGATVKDLVGKTVQLTKNGYCPVNAGGEPDGTLITPGVGQSVWFTLLAYATRKDEDLRDAEPDIYWASLEAYQFRVLTGAVATDPADPVRPALPGTGDYLVLGDVRVRDDGSGPMIVEVDNFRRTPFHRPAKIRNAFEVGFPCLMRHVSQYPAFPDPEHYKFGDDGNQPGVASPASELSWYNTEEDFFGGGGFVHDFFGFLHYTQAGAFVWKDCGAGAHKARNAVLVTFPVLNKGLTTVARTVKLRQETGGLLAYNFLGGPEATGGWQSSAGGSTTDADLDLALNFPPGRNLLRLWFIQDSADRLTAAIINDWLHDSALSDQPLVIDAEALQHIVSEANNDLIFQAI
ncbi:MAG: hypothetical protein RLY93_12385 [Sumerlaeia bacterium]